MNIKIDNKDFNYILNNFNIKNRYVVGSRLYGTNKETSDTDIMIIYESNFKSDLYYPNYHQFQYDDVENNIQYILTSERQFFKNLFSGDSTINADIIMFYNDMLEDSKLNVLRTFNIIKAYIGFAKRDIKKIDKGKNKLFHVQRGLYCAEELLNNRIPKISQMLKFDNNDINYLKEKENYLRDCCNKMFEKGELTMFPKEPIVKNISPIELKMIEANNIKEFKYD